MQKWITTLGLTLAMIVLAAGLVFADNMTLTIGGLLEQELIVPVSMLETLPRETVAVVAINSAGEEMPFSATGALFSDLLAEFGKKQESLLKIQLVAGDGYSIEVPNEVLAKRQILLAYQIDERPLGEDSAPLRVVIPGERAMYWVRNLSRINVLDQVLDQEGQ